MNKSPLKASGKPKVALIAGPTGSGKSALALALAERAGGIVVNADSAQVYRDLRIISARPSAQDEARAPHQLYGYRDGAEPCSAAAWAEDARNAIGKAHEAEKLPILVGGTGLYIRTLLDGIAPIPEIDPEIRARVRAMPVDHGFAALATEDPDAARRIRPSDTARIARALEVIRSTGRPIADWQKERKGGISDTISLAPIILLPPRGWLHASCGRRFEQMFREEGIAEVDSLLKRGLNPLLPVMRAIGVPEISAYLNGTFSREQAIEAGKIATRQYAKRQYTWFSRQPPSGWRRWERPLDCSSVDDALAAFASGEE